MVGLHYQDIFLVTEDKVRLHGWFVPHPKSRSTLLVFHGNAGNISHRVHWIKMLHEAAGHVLMIDYRGYGKSEGQPFEEGLYRDARAAYEWWTRERSSLGRKTGPGRRIDRRIGSGGPRLKSACNRVDPSIPFHYGLGHGENHPSDRTSAAHRRSPFRFREPRSQAFAVRN